MRVLAAAISMLFIGVVAFALLYGRGPERVVVRSPFAASEPSDAPIAQSPSRESVPGQSGGIGTAVSTRARRLVVRDEAGVAVAGAQAWIADETQIDARGESGWFFGEQDAQAVLAANGRSLVTDGDGSCELPATSGWTFVAARLADAFGLEPFDAGQAGPVIVVELVREATVTVIVEDQQGNLRPDIPVVLEQVRGVGYPVHTTEFLGVAGSGQTQVYIPHARWRMRAGRSHPKDTNYYLRTYVTLHQSNRLPIDPEEPPREPVRLLFSEPTGSVRVRVEEPDGTPYLGRARVETGWGGSHSGWNESRTTTRGEVVLPCVLLDRPLALNVRCGDGEVIRVTEPGPRVEGVETVLIARRSDPAQRLAGVRGSVYLPDGRPLADARVLFAEASPTRTGQEQPTTILATDEDGRFSGLLSRPLTVPLRGPLRVQPLDAAGRDRPGLEAELSLAAPLAPGTNDVGEVHLRAIPLLVKGRVVREDGCPVVDAQVAVTPRQVSPALRMPTDRVRSTAALARRSDGDGRFAFHVESSDTEGEVRVTDGGQSHEASFRRGDEVQLRLPAVGSAGIRLLVDEGIPLQQVRVTLVREGCQPRRPAPDGNGWFVARDLEAGAWRIAIAADEEPDAPVLVLDDVRVPASGDCDDPRVDPLDLRGRFTGVRLSCVDGHGQPLRAWFVIPARGLRSNRTSQFGRARIVTGQRDGLALVVMAEGHRPVGLGRARGDCRVVLRDGPQVSVRLRLPVDPAEFAACSARVRIELQRPEDPSWMPYSQALPGSDGTPEGDEIVLRVGLPGTYRVTWTLTNGANNRTFVLAERAGMAVLDGAPNPCELAVDAVTIERARRVLAAPR